MRMDKEQNMENLQQISTLISTIPEAGELNQVIDMVKSRRRQLNTQAIRSFSVGDRVQFTNRSGTTVVGTVDKVNPKTVGVAPDNRGRKWRVPPTMLSRVDE